MVSKWGEWGKTWAVDTLSLHVAITASSTIPRRELFSSSSRTCLTSRSNAQLTSPTRSWFGAWLILSKELTAICNYGRLRRQSVANERHLQQGTGPWSIRCGAPPLYAWLSHVLKSEKMTFKIIFEIHRLLKTQFDIDALNCMVWQFCVEILQWDNLTCLSFIEFPNKANWK